MTIADKAVLVTGRSSARTRASQNSTRPSQKQSVSGDEQRDGR
jgi:hypothetical protein